MNAWQVLKSYFQPLPKLNTKDSGLMQPGDYTTGLTNRQWMTALQTQLGLYTGSRIDYAEEVGDLSLSSLLMAAVNWFGTTMPEAPLVIQLPKGDKWETQIGHPLAKLWARPNAYFTGEQLSLAIALSWMFDGNVYFYKVRNFAGEVIEQWYLPHFLVEPEFDPYDPSVFIKSYLYQVNGVDYHLPVEDVLHIKRGLDPANPRKGLSLVKPILREVYTDNEAANYGAVMFRNLGLPGLVIAPSDAVAQVSPEARTEMREKFESEFSGDGRGKIMIASRKVDVHQLSFNPEQMVVPEARYISEERWASLTGIPAVVLQFGAGLRRSTYNNYSEAVRQAYHAFLLPTLKQIASQISLHLVEETEPLARAFFNIDDMQVLQEDRNELSKRITNEWQFDLITRKEAKLMLGREVAADDEIYYSQFKAQFAIQPTKPDSKADDEEEEKALPLEQKKSAASDEAIGAQWWKDFANNEAEGLLEAEVIESEDV